MKNKAKTLHFQKSCKKNLCLKKTYRNRFFLHTDFIIILTAPDRDRHGCCTGGVTESCDHRLTHASHVGEGIFSGDREVQCVQKFWSDYLNLVIFEVFGVTFSAKESFFQNCF